MQTARNSATNTIPGQAIPTFDWSESSMTNKTIQQNSVCSLETCSEPVKTKGLCKLHYQRQWRTGSVSVSRPCLHLSAHEKFWHYVNKDAPNGCWLWTGFKDKDGYGKMRVGKLNVRAHRISYELVNGPIPEGQLILHNNECNNPSCVNPSHLRTGDHDENMQDRIDAGHYATGERHHYAKLTDVEAEAVRCAPGTYKQIARRFGISVSQVGNIKRGDQRKAD
jgi:hypothetical protein